MSLNRVGFFLLVLLTWIASNWYFTQKRPRWLMEFHHLQQPRACGMSFLIRLKRGRHSAQQWLKTCLLKKIISRGMWHECSSMPLPSCCQTTVYAALTHPWWPQDIPKAESYFACSSLWVCFMIKLLKVTTPNMQLQFHGSCDIILLFMLWISFYSKTNIILAF